MAESPQKCTRCNGLGTYFEDPDDPRSREMHCPLCHGTTWMKVKNGEWIGADKGDWEVWRNRNLPPRPRSIVPYGKYATDKGRALVAGEQDKAGRDA